MKLAPAVRYLRDYVAIPSVNPMRRDDIEPSIAGEARYAEHLREQLRRLGLDAELTGPAERPSVIAEATATGATETLLVASHLDTVPVDGMEIDPFDPHIEGGRLYGRGSCDTKGGMAALVAAVGESDEELGSIGARAIVAHLADRLPGAGGRASRAAGRSAPAVSWAIATEPTDLRVVTCHRGVIHAKLCATGVAGHSSDPSIGRNAIVALARATLALDELGDALGEHRHPRLGPATLSIGLVEGGSAVNVIPDRASLTLDRRTLPGESARWSGVASRRAPSRRPTLTRPWQPVSAPSPARGFRRRRPRLPSPRTAACSRPPASRRLSSDPARSCRPTPRVSGSR
jgi:acetylornithine deacetylase